MPAFSFYRIEIDNSDDTTSILYRKCKRCKTASGMDRQHNRVVNETVDAIREVRGWKRLTVARVPAQELVEAGVL